MVPPDCVAMPPLITKWSDGLEVVLPASQTNPPDCVSVPLLVMFEVEVVVPPCTSTVPALVMPASVAVPFSMVNIPVAFTVRRPVAVNAPPVVTVSEAPVALLLTETVVTDGTLEEMTG